MHNIMKAMNYQIRRDNFLIYSIIAGVFPIVSILIDNMKDLNGGMVVVNMGMGISVFMELALIILIPRICGWDYTDKTMNYELLAGHKRADVFWSRAILSIIWGLGIAIVVVALPLLIVSLILGWGNNLDFGNAFIRLLLTIFPLFRLICELTLLTFLLKNCYISIIFSYMYIMFSTMAVIFVEELSDFRFTSQLSVANAMRLLDFSNYSLGFVNGEDIYIYESAIEGGFAAETIIVSLIGGAVCLLIGFLIFKKSDVN